MPQIVDGELTSLALCWRLERSDGAGIAVTSHDTPLTHDQIAHSPATGIVPAAVTRSLGLEPHSSEISAALSVNSLDETDLALGRWDGARGRLTAVDWPNTAMAGIELLTGELGNVAIDGDSFSAELRGAATKLDAPVCPATSAECRAQFGDKSCRVDLAGRTRAATVIAASYGLLTLEQSVDSNFVLGRLRYLSGTNCGIATTIVAVAGNQVTVRDLPRAPVEVGCRIEIREGCDKRFQTCVERFANAINFRGEPHLPGNDLLTRYPGV